MNPNLRTRPSFRLVSRTDPYIHAVVRVVGWTFALYGTAMIAAVVAWCVAKLVFNWEIF